MDGSILSIDPGTNYGWAIKDWITGEIKHGARTLRLAHTKYQKDKLFEGKHYGFPENRYGQLYQEIEDKITCNDIKYLVYEAASAYSVLKSVDAAMLAGGWQCVFNLLAIKYSLVILPLHIGQIKVAMTGNGSASKQDMIDAAIKRGFTPENEHAADALGGLFLGLTMIPDAVGLNK